MDLPILERAMDNTALSAYMACPREFLFSMVMHRRQKGREKQALTFGSLWHKILETHYKTGGNTLEVNVMAHEYWLNGDGGDQPGDHRTLARALMDYDKYRKHWPLDRDLDTTIGFPDNPMVELSTSVVDESLDQPYAGKIDRMVAEEMSFIEDHKTSSRMDKYYFQQFVNSNQMKGYTWLANKLVPSHKFVGVRINVYHILKTKTDFHRQIITFSPAVLREWEENFNMWMARVRLDYWAWRIQKGEDPDELGIDLSLVDLLRSWEPFPGHFGDNGCSRKYGNCTYFHVCRLSPRIQMKALEQDFEVRPWNPLDIEDEDEDSSGGAA